jgi:hypothetical protein
MNNTHELLPTSDLDDDWRASTPAAEGMDQGQIVLNLPEPPVFVPTSHINPGERYEIRYRPEAGSEFSIHSVEKITGRRTVMGEEILFNSESTADLGVRVIAAESDGMDLELSYQDHSFSSDSPQTRGTADFTGLIGQNIRARLSATGEWSDFRGIDQVPQVTLPGKNVPWGENHCLLEVRNLLPRLPGRRVEMGESWITQYTHEELFVGEFWIPVTVYYAYTLWDCTRAWGKDCVKVAANFTFHAEGEFVADGSTWEITFEGSGSESYHFDCRKGMVRRYENTLTLAGQAVAEEIGMVVPFNNEIESKIEVDF